MRNLVTQTIPAGAILMIKVNPPIAEDDMPFVLGASVVTQVVDSRTVSITNPTDRLIPFAFFIGSRKALNAANSVANALRSFLGP